jgi:hypothetical protein
MGYISYEILCHGMFVTWTLNTPQMVSPDPKFLFAFSNNPAGSSRFPSTSVILEDSRASFCADGDFEFRVTASIRKGAFLLMRFLITDPPCLPVAPVMRMVGVTIVRERAVNRVS